MAVHETVAEPELVTVGGLNDPQDRPGGEVMLKVTVPAKPLTVATVTVEVGDWPALIGAGDVAVIVKSWKWKIAFVEWFRDPLVPVRVRL